VEIGRRRAESAAPLRVNPHRRGPVLPSTGDAGVCSFITRDAGKRNVDIMFALGVDASLAAFRAALALDGELKLCLPSKRRN